jgi:hypothetical protein
MPKSEHRLHREEHDKLLYVDLWQINVRIGRNLEPSTDGTSELALHRRVSRNCKCAVVVFVIFQLARALRFGLVARLALLHAVLAAALMRIVMLLRFHPAHIALMPFRLTSAFFASHN